jgi:hypothetical protein
VDGKQALAQFPGITLRSMLAATLGAKHTGLSIGDLVPAGDPQFKMVGSQSERVVKDGRDGINVTIRWEPV